MSDSPISVWLPKQVYFPGETVRGKLFINLSEPLRVNAVTVTFEGVEKGFLQHFYFSHTEILFGSEIKDATTKEKEANYHILDPGTHQYDFKYELPELTPFSLEESKFCRTFYQAVAAIVSPKTSQTKAFEFIVSPLNPFDVVKVPTSSESDRKKSGLTLMVTTENYQCVGDTMIVHVKVRKTEAKVYKLREVTAKLYEKRYRKTSDTRDEFLTVIAENKINMKLRESEQYVEKALDLKIPITSLPDSFTKFDLFTITHELEVALDIKWRPNLKVKIPITIYPSRYYPHKQILEATFTKLIDRYIDAKAKDEGVEIALAKVLTRFPGSGAEALMVVVTDILKKGKDASAMLYALHLMENATKRVGSVLADNFSISYYNSVFKKFLRSKQNGRAEPIPENLELPGEAEPEDLDLRSGDPIVEKIISLMKRWSALSLKWKEGPFQELVKKGIVFSERMSLIVNNEDDKSYDSSINELSVDNFIKIFLMEVVRNVSFFNDMHKKDDYPADVSLVMEWVFLQLETYITQVKRLIKNFSNDKNHKLTVEVLEEIYDKICSALRRKKGEEETHNTVNLDGSEETAKKRNSESTSEEEQQILHAVNKLMPLEGLFTRTYGIPKLKIHNGSIAANILGKEDEKVVALADLSAYGASKSVVILGLKGIYYNNDGYSKKPGGGFIPYDAFVNAKINGTSSEISVGDAVFYIQQSKIRADSFVSVLESLRDGLYFANRSSKKVTKSPSKSSKRESSSSSSSEEELVKPEKKVEPKEGKQEQEEPKDKPLLDLNF